MSGDGGSASAKVTGNDGTTRFYAMATCGRRQATQPARVAAGRRAQDRSPRGRKLVTEPNGGSTHAEPASLRAPAVWLDPIQPRVCWPLSLH
jgi:hypothetical protein